MQISPEQRARFQSELETAARSQDQYDLTTTNLIAPASPTPFRYLENLALRHNAIAEGTLRERLYAGVEGFNRIEAIAAQLSCQVFGAEHANVQPHSVSQANQAAYQALLKNGDRVLAMKFHDGGHLTHGLKSNFSGRFFDFAFYGVSKEGYLDYDQIGEQAREFKPKLIVCGASSYSRTINFERLADTAKEVGAHLMADLSHPAGLIAADRFPQPFPHCDVVTLTLDKTMLGVHGGIVLCKEEFAERIDKAVHPGVQSSVPLRRIYEMAQCLIDSSSPEFRDYIDRVLKNIKVFEKAFGVHKNSVVTGGSDTHLMVLDVLNTFGLTGKDAEQLLESIGVLTNRQVIPGETQKFNVTSGIRLGTSWITARGYSEVEAGQVARVVLENLERSGDTKLQENSRIQLTQLLNIRRQGDVWYEEIK